MLATFGKWLKGIRFNMVPQTHIGATEDWKPQAEVKEATRRMIPFDDVDEWLATRQRALDHKFAQLTAEVDQAFKTFVQESLRNTWYRRELQRDTPTAWTVADAKRLRAITA